MAILKSSTAPRGIVAVEMALVLPVLLLLVFGLIEYGWMFLKVQQINDAARQGARIGVIADATNTDIQTAVADIMTSANLSDTGYQLTMQPIDTSTLLAGETLSITVAVPYDAIDLIGIPMIPAPQTLRASISMAKEGAD